MDVGGDDRGVVFGETEVGLITGGLFVGEFRNKRADFFNVSSSCYGEKVRVGKVTVIVRVLLGSHFLGFFKLVTPSTGRLHEWLAGIKGFALAGDFIVDGAAHGGG